MLIHSLDQSHLREALPFVELCVVHVNVVPSSFTRKHPIGATTMKLLNRLSDKIAGRPSSSQTSDDTAQLLRSSSNTSSSPTPLHASLPYGFEWSPRPLSHGQTWMLSTSTLALGRDYKQASSLALLEK